MKPFKIILPAIFLFFQFHSEVLAQTEVPSLQTPAYENALSGWATAIDGNHAIVSAPQKDEGDRISVGEVYFYRYQDNAWLISNILQPDDLPAMSNFGISTAIDGETAIISSLGDHQGGLFSGAVHVYELAGTEWVKETVLYGSEAKTGHRFGLKTDIKDGMIVSGAYMGDGEEERSGVVYVFEKHDDEWSETAILSAEDGKNGHYFGYTTHIVNENMIAVGAYKASGNSEETGAVYIFKKENSEWVQKNKLVPPAGDISDNLGYSLSSITMQDEMGNETHYLFSGAPGSKNNDIRTGSVFVFENIGNQWELIDEFYHEEESKNSHFGISLATNGSDRLYVGASRISQGSKESVGSVYEYDLNLSEGSFLMDLNAKMYATTSEEFENYGYNVSATSNFLLISSPYSNRDGVSNSGRVHFYGDLSTSGENIDSVVNTFELHQNYPNPFNPVTVIGYQLPVNSDVRLEVYDMLGRRVAVLVNERIEAGIHEVDFDASNLASGIYIYRLVTESGSAGQQTLTKKLTLIK